MNSYLGIGLDKLTCQRQEMATFDFLMHKHLASNIPFFYFFLDKK